MIGTLVELFHDDKGIIWPKSVAPYQVHLVSIQSNEKAEGLYQNLQKKELKSFMMREKFRQDKSSTMRIWLEFRLD